MSRRTLKETVQEARPVEAALARAWEALPSGGRVLLAVSGGVDSMVLLEAAARLAGKKLQLRRLLVLHVNHGLRGEESDADERLVLRRAAELGLEARACRLHWEGEAPSQDACRRKREAFFRSELRAPGDRILLAHHLNDQAETVFFRLLRGTGAKGLRGMLFASGAKVRPFLGLEKEALVRAARAWGLAWREDSSNQSLGYDRNWVRSLFPLIEARRPGFQGKLAALAEEAQGWILPDHRLETFPLGPGISFARPGEGVAAAALGETYRLSRKQAEALRATLAKPGARCEAEGVRFTWSAGLLLAERGKAVFPRALMPAGEGRWESVLGTWLFSSLPAFRRGGERAKKEFQALRVPIFFRDCVPVVAGPRERPLALLPPRLARFEGVSFEPSALGRWWLKPPGA
jgi:tRNA(Ile)-lysidine synthetase-like protein